jgi:sulfur carrier protein
MPITVNGDSHPWHEELTVSRLMDEKKFSFPLKFVVINGKRIPKSEWDRHLIAEGDEVNVIHLMSGG